MICAGGDRDQDPQDYTGEIPGLVAFVSEKAQSCQVRLLRLKLVWQELGLNEKIQFANRKAVGAGGKRQLVARPSFCLHADSGQRRLDGARLNDHKAVAEVQPPSEKNGDERQLMEKAHGTHISCLWKLLWHALAVSEPAHDRAG